MTETLTEISDEVSDTQYGRYLTFSLGREAFGIEIKYVMEIVKLQKITPLPESPNYIKGIINLRKAIIPIIDMRLRLIKEAASYNERTCIIIIGISGILVGLIVDRVDEVLTIDDQDIAQPPDFKSGYQNRYIKGIGKIGENMKLLLDCRKLFDIKELQTFNNIRNKENIR